MTPSLLYVEDDEALARATEKAFSRRGFDVCHCSSVADALRALEQRRFSHALLDLKLVEGSSLSLIPPLIEHNPHTKVVVLTGYASIATAVHAMKLGATNYLAKPATAEQIMAAFDDFIDSEPALEGSAPPSLKRLEWESIQQALQQNNGNISATARQLKIHRRTLQRKLIKRPVKK